MSGQKPVNVAIVGMGCTKFGDHWDRGADDLLVDAVRDALVSAGGMALDDVEAFWLGTAVTGQSGLVLSKPLKIVNKPSPVWRICAPPGPRLFATRVTPWRRARTTSPWPSASRS